MTAIADRRLFLFACVLAAAFASPDAQAGGDMMGPDELQDQGPTYFGFVKDGRGAPIRDAKVTLVIKNGLTLITRTDDLGLYKVGNLSKQLKPDDVSVSCSKEGYRQTRVLRRTSAKVEPGAPVETECRMERG
jgi:hypothetical protein